MTSRRTVVDGGGVPGKRMTYFVIPLAPWRNGPNAESHYGERPSARPAGMGNVHGHGDVER